MSTTKYGRNPRDDGVVLRASFTLVTLHVLWGSNAAERLPEIREIARWLADWAGGGDEFAENLLTLGDFNIDRQGDPLYQAFTATGLTPAQEHVGLPRTLFDDPIKKHFYDQIAWFTGAAGTRSSRHPFGTRASGATSTFDRRSRRRSPTWSSAGGSRTTSRCGPASRCAPADPLACRHVG